MTIKKKPKDKVRFDRSVRYVNSHGQKFGKGVWIDEDGVMLLPGNGKMDRTTNSVLQYNSDGTITRYSYRDWTRKHELEHEYRVLQNDRKYAIPYISSKKMTLTIDKSSPTRRNAGATFSENLLDSIAVNAKKAGLPFSTALGIVSQESTIGQGKRGVGKTMLPWTRYLNATPNNLRTRGQAISYNGVYSPTLLISNWKQIAESPFYEYYYNKKGYLLPPNELFNDSDYDDKINGTRTRSNQYQLKDESPLEHGFRKYNQISGIQEIKNIQRKLGQMQQN